MRRQWKITAAAIITGMGIALFASGCIREPHKSYLLSWGNAFVVTTDYSTGGFTGLDVGSLTALPDYSVGRGRIHSDAVARYFNNAIYVVNRLGRDNIQKISPQIMYVTVAEASMGTGSNPHDIWVVSPEKAYVTRYESGSLFIINPATCFPYGSIDLSPYAEPSAGGVPRMDRLYFHEPTGRLFVSLQRLTGGLRSSAYGSVVVINTSTDTVEAEIPLTWNGGSGSASNPYSAFRFVPASWWQPSTPDGNDHLFISCVGNFGYWFQLDGGIVAIDVQDLHCEEGFVAAEAALNAEITDFVVKSGTELYATVSDAYFHTRLVKINPQTGETVKVMQQDFSDYGYLWSVALHSSGRLLLCDRNALYPGVLAYDTNNNDNPLNYGVPVNVGLPPFMVVPME